MKKSANSYKILDMRCAVRNAENLNRERMLLKAVMGRVCKSGVLHMIDTDTH